MSSKNRCFGTIKALKRLRPELLCDVLRKFPECTAEYGIHLPAEPDFENMPYEAIHAACMYGELPQELDDVFYFTCALGTTPGWENIKSEASFQRLDINFPTEKHTTADLVMRAWLHNWPRNRRLLEQSYARAKIHAKSAYVYYAPSRDFRSLYKAPDEAQLESLRQRLDDHFVQEGIGKGTSVVMYDFEKEIWFLVRHPGHTQRYSAISEDGELTSVSFKPEEYDAVVYHKEFGDLRLNTNRPGEHTRYRIEFADLLLNETNVFNPNYKMIRLTPLLGNCQKLFRCNDIPGLSHIVPIDISYTTLKHPDVMMRMKALNDSHLMLYEASLPNLMGDPEADSVLSARFRYRLKDRKSTGALTVHTGNALTYERDGDSSVLETWLRKRKFISSLIEGYEHEPQLAANH